MCERYRSDMVTQDAEPQAVTRPLAYADTLDQARQLAAEFGRDGRDYYVAIYDRDAADYLDT